MIEHKKCCVVLIFNDNGEVALQLRASDDDSYPAHWDTSAGGSIEKNEDEKESALRELEEELGIVVDLEFVSKEDLTYPSWTKGITREAEVWIYKGKHEGPFTPDQEEVQKVEFFSQEELGKMIESGENIHPELVLLHNNNLIF